MYCYVMFKGSAVKQWTHICLKLSLKHASVPLHHMDPCPEVICESLCLQHVLVKQPIPHCRLSHSILHQCVVPFGQISVDTYLYV